MLNCYSNPVAPAVPWSTIVTTAQAKIVGIDKTAALHDVSASPVAFEPPNWDYSKTLVVEFSYVTATNEDITLTMYDSDPAGTLQIKRRQASFGKQFYSDQKSHEAEYDQKLAAIKIGPREAGAATWQDVTSHSPGAKLSPMIDLDLMGTGNNWNVSYMDSNKSIFDFLSEPSYDVDGATGKIVSADYNKIVEMVNQTPAPTPQIYVGH